MDGLVCLETPLQKDWKQVMKSFHEIRTKTVEKIEIDEGRIIKHGSALMFARQAQMHGNQAEQHFKIAKQNLTRLETLTPKEKEKLIIEGLGHICDGMISIRNQNGAITGIVTTSALLGDQSHKKMSKLLRRH